MRKPAELRTHLTAWVPALDADPDKLHVFIDEGRIAASGTRALAFEYHYTLNLIVTDWTDDADMIVVPILAWLKENQPDAFGNPDNAKDAFVFEAEIIDHTCLDLSIKLKLSERVTSRDAGGGRLEVTHLSEPNIPGFGGVDSAITPGNGERLGVYVNGEKVGEWNPNA